ncbi:MAG: DUF4255 domain-containing protein [Cyanobacteria bacterium J06635_15]
MSNSLAIATVTATLKNIIFAGIREELGNGTITTKSLERARDTQEGNQINLCLYHAEPNPARQGQSKTPHARRGATFKPPLALDLHYLIAAYGQGDQEIASHRLLGRVLNVLHDHSLLNAEEIQAVTQGELSTSNLHQQVEQIRIAPLNLAFEDMTQVWRLLQAEYRPSVAYKVSVVLLDSQEPIQLAPPVLSRAGGNGRAIVRAHGEPKLHEIELPHHKNSAEFGDRVMIRGQNFNGDRLRVRLTHPRLAEPWDLDVLPVQSTGELSFHLPDPTSNIAPAMAGRYELALAIERANYTMTTNRLPVTLAPQLLTLDPQETTQRNFVLTVTCFPLVSPESQVILLFGDRGMPVLPFSEATDTLRFQIKNVHPGTYVVRLRVNGADSVPIDFSSRPPQFLESHTVRILA